MQLQHLEEAERHIAQGQRHIAGQKLLIAGLEEDGHDTTQARRPLDNFHATQAQHVAYRDRILEELGHPPEQWPSREPL